tara:strand:- start:246 stop:452 length:207 start_codon:yes stop_codon:yes gene_type:complete
MFTYKIHKETLTDGIRLVIEGEKNEVKHTFTSIISYKELEKKTYEDFIESFLGGLEEKINILSLNNIY